MSQYTQQNRTIAIGTPLGEDVLLLNAFSGHEAMSQLFRFELDLLSENDKIRFEDIVGKNVTLRMTLTDGSSRYWNGCVSRFSQGGRNDRLTSYRAEMVPWLWFLSKTSDCRIFQNKKVPDIIQQIFSELGFSDFTLRLYGDFVQREYCVQYRETDFNFVSRLMEQEGIYYFFEHEQEKHILVLANDPAAHKPCPNQSKVRCHFASSGGFAEEAVYEWRQEQEFQAGSYALSDYNFETPKNSLAATVAGENAWEIYDYPGEYRSRSEGDALARIRLQEQRAAGVLARGSSGCRTLGAGHRFDLSNHYRQDLNRAYVLIAVRHQASQEGTFDATTSSQGVEFTYSNTFQCIPHPTQFRASRLTPRPAIQGSQTAIVVGPKGEEVFTDKHGRVKVQFHWDREGKHNESSSCWIRVSHPWAGKGWGAVSIPRIGQEVIVDFLEGDPDQPIVVGRVYNAEQMPPYELPANKTQSGVKSRSSLRGGDSNFNEIRFEDKKGEELVYVHAEKDMSTHVENEERIEVEANSTTKIHGNAIKTVGKNSTETIAIAKALTIGAAYQVSVGGAMNETVGAFKAEEIGAYRLEVVGGYKQTRVREKFMVKVDDQYALEAEEAIEIKSGSASLTMKKDGKIEISGTDVTFKTAAGKVHIDAGGIITIKGSMVKINT